MTDAAIEAVGVSKRFARHTRRATSLKELFVSRGGHAEDFWALRDIDVSIAPGQTVGLIGSNGAGKSTLLKVLSGILSPSSGDIRVQGRIGSLLELGAGFNVELSGRDNIFLNASLLGLSRKETQARFDEIVEFSELAPFIDTQVKHYSSGMYVRLGFAVAVNVEPDILLIDEVLAVGDEAFQQKCLAKISEFQRGGRTILFVSHSLDLVADICNRAVVLDHGQLRFDGDAGEAAAVLRGIMSTSDHSGGHSPHADAGLRVSDLRLRDLSGNPTGNLFAGDPLVIEVDVTTTHAAEVAVRAVALGPADVPVFGLDHTQPIKVHPDRPRTVRFRIPEVPPLQGIFALSIALRDATTGTTLDARRFGEAFSVRSSTDSYALVDVGYASEVAPE